MSNNKRESATKLFDVRIESAVIVEKVSETIKISCNILQYMS